MPKLFKAFFIAALTMGCVTVFADDGLDKASDEALKKTQEVLRDPTKRAEAMKEFSKAQEGDKHLDSMSGNAQNKEAMYQVSASIMENMVKAANGDPAAMQKMMEDAQKDPETFYKTMLSEDQKNQVRGIANDIEKAKSPTPPTPK